MNKSKSKYYDGAHTNFERAGRCYEQAGLGAEWADTVHHIRANHRTQDQEADRAFDRMLWLNPSDNQGVRFLIDDVRAQVAWEKSSQR